MNINLLRTFATVVESGSFRKAAKSLHLSQPGVSLQMAALAQQFGLPMFDHQKNRWTLTEAGQLLYRHARSILNAVDKLEGEMGELAHLQKGHLHLGTTLSIANILPRYLAEFEKRHPRITCQVTVDNTFAMQEGLLSWQLDLAFVEGRITAPDLSLVPFREDRLVLVLPKGHPLAGLKKIAPADLTEAEFILREKGSGTRDLIEVAFGALFRNLKVKLELSHAGAILAAVEAGLGISILSPTFTGKGEEIGSIVTREIEGIDLARRFCLVYQKDKHLSPGAQALLDLVREMG